VGGWASSEAAEFLAEGSAFQTGFVSFCDFVYLLVILIGLLVQNSEATRMCPASPIPTKVYLIESWRSALLGSSLLKNNRNNLFHKCSITCPFFFFRKFLFTFHQVFKVVLGGCQKNPG
jgi:hypothetical protein